MASSCILLLYLFVSIWRLSDSKLVWSDEFEGKAQQRPSADKWNYDIGDGSTRGLKGWGNSELQYYTDFNAFLDGGGNLAVTADNNNGTNFKCYYGDCRYTSARLVSKLSAHYGRIEARVKVPQGKGLWPAFWMMGSNMDCVGWPKSGEIDVMEIRGSKVNAIQGSLHGPGYSAGAAISATFTLPFGQTFADDFHVFAVDWDANVISWSVDDLVYSVKTPADLGDFPWVFDHPFHIIFNLAVGGHFDGEPDDLQLPKTMLIDYIRVYDKPQSLSISYQVLNSIDADAGPLVWSSEFNEPKGTSPPSDKWIYNLGDGSDVGNKGWGNSEWQFYTNETDNCATDGEGNLVITARTDNAAKYNCYTGGKCKYTSARITTFGKFGHKYGRFETRLKMPAGLGLWPAFWLMGDNFMTSYWPLCGAIVMEMKGGEPSVMTATIHGPGYYAGSAIKAKYTLPVGQTFADDFHVFGIDWEPQQITFSVDGISFRSMTVQDTHGNQWVFDHPFHILMNMAVGGSYAGYPLPNATFPQRYLIDYVRVYDLGAQ